MPLNAEFTTGQKTSFSCDLTTMSVALQMRENAKLFGAHERVARLHMNA
jgi:hypothetical protein